MGYLSKEALATIGFKHIGSGVLISDKASIIGPENMSIGDNVRIDDFCILTGTITIGSNVHISAYCALYGKLGISLDDYTGLSARTTIYSAMDDFSGDYLIGPIHEANQIHVTGGLVVLEKFTQVGAHSVVFPNVVIHEGTVVGAMSLVKESLQPWCIYAGIPVKVIKERRRGLLNKI